MKDVHIKLEDADHAYFEQQAKEMGLPTNTWIKSVLHQFATGKDLTRPRVMSLEMDWGRTTQKDTASVSVPTPSTGLNGWMGGAATHEKLREVCAAADKAGTISAKVGALQHAYDAWYPDAVAKYGPKAAPHLPHKYAREWLDLNDSALEIYDVLVENGAPEFAYMQKPITNPAGLLGYVLRGAAKEYHSIGGGRLVDEGDNYNAIEIDENGKPTFYQLSDAEKQAAAAQLKEIADRQSRISFSEYMRKEKADG